MTRPEILRIYNESGLPPQKIRKIFSVLQEFEAWLSSREDKEVKIFVPDCPTVIAQVFSEHSVYVTHSEKSHRAVLHRYLGVKLIGDQTFPSAIRLCGKYRKFPGCQGCPEDSGVCLELLGDPQNVFDAIIAVDTKDIQWCRNALKSDGFLGILSLQEEQQ